MSTEGKKIIIGAKCRKQANTWALRFCWVILTANLCQTVSKADWILKNDWLTDCFFDRSSDYIALSIHTVLISLQQFLRLCFATAAKYLKSIQCKPTRTTKESHSKSFFPPKLWKLLNWDSRRQTQWCQYRLFVSFVITSNIHFAP